MLQGPKCSTKLSTTFSHFPNNYYIIIRILKYILARRVGTLGSGGQGAQLSCLLPFLIIPFLRDFFGEGQQLHSTRATLPTGCNLQAGMETPRAQIGDQILGRVGHRLQLRPSDARRLPRERGHVQHVLRGEARIVSALDGHVHQRGHLGALTNFARCRLCAPRWPTVCAPS